MKKLFFCCFISFLISGCISKKIDSRISINNNYNAIFHPIVIPNSKIIKKQVIITIVAEKMIKTTIESNSNGLIEKLFFDYKPDDISLNYQNNTIHYLNTDAIFQSQDGNIISISDKDGGTLASLYYNELGQLIKIDDINPTTKEKRLQVFNYYNNKTIIYGSIIKNNFDLTKFIYNDNWELSGSVHHRYIITDDKSKTNNSNKPNLKFDSLDKELENLKPTDYKCVYYNQNQYGDWIDGYCQFGDGKLNSIFKRNIEYY